MIGVGLPLGCAVSLLKDIWGKILLIVIICSLIYFINILSAAVVFVQSVCVLMSMNWKVWGHRDHHHHGQKWSPQPWIRIKSFMDADCASISQANQNITHTCLKTHTYDMGWLNTQTCLCITHTYTRTGTYCLFVCIWVWLNVGELRPCFHSLKPVSVWSDSKVPAGFEDGGLPLLGQPLKPHAW